jgi:uncharacterized membrane protein YdjX (TVP38/TMEM64 family)
LILIKAKGVKKTKLLIFVFIISIMILFYASGSQQHLELKNIQENLDQLRTYYNHHPFSTMGIFLGTYVFITSLSIPGAIVLTLLSGAIFGVWNGTLLVSLGSTAGATIAFLMSRYLFRESLMKKFQRKFRKVNHQMQVNGNSYLFTLRLVPVSPYVVINILMGLTSIRTWSFAWITFVAMFPGNLVYVLAGRKISEISTASEILTWQLILILTLLGALPFFLKKIGKLLAGNRTESQEAYEEY